MLAVQSEGEEEKLKQNAKDGSQSGTPLIFRGPKCSCHSRIDRIMRNESR